MNTTANLIQLVELVNFYKTVAAQIQSLEKAKEAIVALFALRKVKSLQQPYRCNYKRS